MAVSLLLTLITGLQPEFREALRLLWLSTLATLLIVSLSVLQPRLYIAQRTFLMVAARALIALLIPQFVYLLAVTPYKGSSMLTPSLASSCGVWFWNTRWLGEQVGGACVILCNLDYMNSVLPPDHAAVAYTAVLAPLHLCAGADTFAS